MHSKFLSWPLTFWEANISLKKLNISLVKKDYIILPARCAKYYTCAYSLDFDNTCTTIFSEVLKRLHEDSNCNNHTVKPQISTICTNLHYLHKSRLSAQISTICTNIHYLHKYTLSAQIYTISILSAQILVFQNWGFPDFPGCKSSIKFLSIWLPDSLFKRYNTIFLFYI